MPRDEFFAIAASSKPPAANSRRHRRSTVCAALPHPSTKLPPRKTARSDALSFEMSALEARPPTAPESWLPSGISSPPWDRSFHDLAPNTTGGIRERLRTGHRPGTDPLPVGQCLDPSQTGPHTHHASADLTPGSGVDSTHWSLLHSPAGGDEFARLILKAYKVVTTTESSVDDERPPNRRASPRRLGASHRVKAIRIRPPRPPG